jgi:hypothetical protein
VERRRIEAGEPHVAHDDDLDEAFVIVGVVPVGAEGDDGVVELHADAPAHGDDHDLAVQCFEAALEVVDQVLGNEDDTAFGAKQRLQLCPAALELLLALDLLALGHLVEYCQRLSSLSKSPRQSLSLKGGWAITSSALRSG